MRRSIALVVALLAVFLFGAQLTAAAVRKPGEKVSVFAQFRLPKTHGYSVSAFTSGERLVLHVAQGGRSNEYEAPALISEHRLKSRFGSLGLIDLRLHVTDVDPVGLPRKGCHGCPLRTDRGIYRGTIRFDGENDFFTLDASRAKGLVEVSERVSGGEGRRIPGEEEPGELTGLSAESKGKAFLAIAVRRPGEAGPASFFTGMNGRQGQVRIQRGASVQGPASTFLIDPKAGSATVQPPFPFSGSATLARNPDGSRSWTGSLSVDLLGVGPVSLVGPQFDVRIDRHFLLP